VINLEGEYLRMVGPVIKILIYHSPLLAAGTSGGAMLFQATAQEMMDAYAHVPRPHGNVIALEVFGSGIIGSE
jgi:hypothetical protein